MNRPFTIAAVLVAGALAVTGPAPRAHAQGTEVGGTVPSVVGLGLLDETGLGELPSAAAAHVYDLAFHATVTATDGPVILTVADGDAPGSDRHGHLSTDSGLLADPLEVRSSDDGAWTSLAGPTDPLVARWPTVVTNAPATVRLRQSVPAHTPRVVRPKTILITASVEGP